MTISTASRPEITTPSSRPKRRSRAWVTFPVALGAVALTAACGPSYGGASPAGSAGSLPAPAATGALVATAATGLGTVLVDGRGRTVYDFANDTGSRSTCNGECASDWPPVAAPDSLPAALPGVSDRLGSTTRADGSRQLTVAGHPVYTFSGDSRPGQTNGNGITLNGGRWTAVAPAGSAPAEGPSAATTY